MIITNSGLVRYVYKTKGEIIQIIIQQILLEIKILKLSKFLCHFSYWQSTNRLCCPTNCCCFVSKLQTVCEDDWPVEFPMDAEIHGNFCSMWCDFF